MFKIKKINQQGMNILEIMVGIAIFVLATVIVSAFIVQNFKSQNFNAILCINKHCSTIIFLLEGFSCSRGQMMLYTG